MYRQQWQKGDSLLNSEFGGFGAGAVPWEDTPHKPHLIVYCLKELVQALA